MIRPVSVLLWLCLFSAPIAATAQSNGPPTARSLQWKLTADRVTGDASQATDLQGDTTWYFLRTTNSQGAITSRTWLRDGKYVPLDATSRRIFDQPLAGFESMALFY